jgi:spore coat polysaccharide biosynthesis protein SpsF
MYRNQTGKQDFERESITYPANVRIWINSKRSKSWQCLANPAYIIEKTNQKQRGQMKTAVIIQARMNSTRLPGKVLMPIIGKPVLQHVIERCKRANVDDVIVATCEPAEDIVKLCRSLNTSYYIGSENNVYQRVLDCAVENKVDVIVEVTADCPLIDPEHMNQLISFYIQKDVYISNCKTRAWSDGFDLQVYHIELLKNCKPKNINHVGWNIWNDQDGDIASWQPKCPSRYRHPYFSVTMDTEEDYKMITKIFEYFNHNKFTAEESMEYIFRHPDVLAINMNVHRKLPGEG